MNQLISKIRQDANQALKAGESQRYQALKYLLSLLQNEEIRLGDKFGENEALAVLQKEMKRKKEALESFKKAGREDLVAQEEEEIKILSQYLPKMMTREELEKWVRGVIKDKGITDFSQAMKEIMPGLKGKADGKMVSEVVKKVLS